MAMGQGSKGLGEPHPNTYFPLRKPPDNAWPPAPPYQSSEAFARSLGRGHRQGSLDPALFQGKWEVPQRTKLSLCPGASAPAYFAPARLTPQGPAARMVAGLGGLVHLPSSHMQRASSAVPPRADIDASEAIVLPAALSPPSDPVGMMFPGLC